MSSHERSVSSETELPSPLPDPFERVAERAAALRDTDDERPELSELIQGDVRAALGGAMRVASHELFRQPESRSWLVRRRSVAAHLAAFAIAGTVACGLDMVFGLPAAIVVGSMLAPLASPYLAFQLAAAFSYCRHRVRIGRPPGALSVASWFLLGFVLPVHVLVPSTNSGQWSTVPNQLLPTIFATVLALLFSPMYTSTAKSDQNRRREGSSRPRSAS